MTKTPLRFSVDGLEYDIHFERRRYGTQFYTWVIARGESGRLDLGDPWPCVIPKRTEIEAAIRHAENRRKSSPDSVRA